MTVPPGRRPPASSPGGRPKIAHIASLDVVILDEACIALSYKLFTVEQLLDALNNRHPSYEAIVTGRNAPLKLINAADLVTEMKEVKHYYTHRVMARDGIER